MVGVIAAFSPTEAISASLKDWKKSSMTLSVKANITSISSEKLNPIFGAASFESPGSSNRAPSLCIYSAGEHVDDPNPDPDQIPANHLCSLAFLQVI